VISRYAFAQGLDVVTGAAARLGVSAVLLFVFLTLRGERAFPLAAAFKWTIPLGLFVAVQNFAIQSAVSLMPAGVAVLMLYLFPFLTGLTLLALGEIRFSVRLAGTLLAALAGLALVLGVSPQPLPLAGIAYGLLAACTFTAALVLTPRLAPGLSAPLRTFYTLAIASIAFTAVVLPSGSIRLPEALGAQLGLVGLSLCYAIGIGTLFMTLPHAGAVQVAVVMNLEPVVVAGLAALLLGEQFTVLQWLGALIVVGAVIVYQLTAPK
jgi:drug/metabolite transporter (DMT)-like permease